VQINDHRSTIPLSFFGKKEKETKPQNYRLLKIADCLQIRQLASIIIISSSSSGSSKITPVLQARLQTAVPIGHVDRF